MNSGPVDLRAHAAQQKIEREAVKYGMADTHPLVVGIVPGAEGVQVQSILVGTCSKCWNMVRGDWWAAHAKTHEAETAVVGDLLSEWSQRQKTQLEEGMRNPDA
jgi:hypothetical protein